MVPWIKQKKGETVDNSTWFFFLLHVNLRVGNRLINYYTILLRFTNIGSFYVYRTNLLRQIRIYLPGQ